MLLKKTKWRGIGTVGPMLQRCAIFLFHSKINFLGDKDFQQKAKSCTLNTN